MNFMKKIEEPQDRYKIAYNNGLAENMLHSFGFWAIKDKQIFDLTTDQRNDLFDAAGYMRTVISEVFKSSENRNRDKIDMFLTLTVNRLDEFYKDNAEADIFHALAPPEGGWERIVRNEKK